jgi:hypothetical protein
MGALPSLPTPESRPSQERRQFFLRASRGHLQQQALQKISRPCESGAGFFSTGGLPREKKQCLEAQLAGISAA